MDLIKFGKKLRRSERKSRFLSADRRPQNKDKREAPLQGSSRFLKTSADSAVRNDNRITESKAKTKSEYKTLTNKVTTKEGTKSKEKTSKVKRKRKLTQ